MDTRLILMCSPCYFFVYHKRKHNAQTTSAHSQTRMQREHAWLCEVLHRMSCWILYIPRLLSCWITLNPKIFVSFYFTLCISIIFKIYMSPFFITWYFRMTVTRASRRCDDCLIGVYSRKRRVAFF